MRFWDTSAVVPIRVQETGWCGQHPAGQDFVTFDKRLRDASHREGFAVLPEAS